VPRCAETDAALLLALFMHLLSPASGQGKL